MGTMADQTARPARLASVAAATAVALACGTNYAYSAWGPEYAKRLRLNQSEGNIIGVAGNLGMYGMGIPAGLLVDRRGPKYGIAMGALALAFGYFPLHSAFVQGPNEYFGFYLSCLCTFFTGAGSCTAFTAAIKTSTFNWPENRGTATAFPLSAFGLSAFVFASVGTLALGDNIGNFILLLAIGTVCLNLLGLPFLRLIALGQEYIAVTNDEGRADMRPPTKIRSRASTMSTVRPEITGLALLDRLEFWQLFFMLSLLAGVGLMTINNIGNNAKALIRHWIPAATAAYYRSRESMHVSLLSICSFLGRILSGIGSDFLIQRLHASRFWCLTVSGVLFTLAQIFAIKIHNPHYLPFVTVLTGLAYGALFGVYPALVADTFGVSGMSLNWGCIIFAPVISGYIFNRYYGWVYDDHSHIINDGTLDCPDGIDCYQMAYFVTCGSSIAAVILSLWCIALQRQRSRGRNRALSASVRYGE